MAITRTLYTTQVAAIGALTGLPIQSASIERTVATEDVLILGRLASASRQQKDVDTYKMDVKFYIATGGAGGLTTANVRTLVNEALSGTTRVISVSPDGFSGSAIMTNFSIEAGVGEFVTASMAFEGLGTPVISSAGNNSTTQGGAAATTVLTAVDVNAGVGTVKSAKFSIDVPTERLSRLNGAISGAHDSADITDNHKLFAKPPLKVSASLDGQSLTISAAPTIAFGSNLSFTPVSSNITSQSFSQAAGDVGAAMSFSVEGTDFS